MTRQVSFNREAYRQFIQIIDSWSYLGTQHLPGGTYRVGHIPYMAPFAYLHALYPGLSQTEIIEMESSIGIALPPSVSEFYRMHNGLLLFHRVCVYGMRYHNDRTAIPSILEQPFDIALPNILERPGAAPPNAVFLANLIEERVLVFATGDGRIALWDVNAEAILRKAYDNIADFLLRAAQILTAQFDSQGRPTRDGFSNLLVQLG